MADREAFPRFGPFWRYLGLMALLTVFIAGAAALTSLVLTG